MNREELTEVLTKIFRDEFDNDTIILNEEISAKDIEDWDSLAHISLVAAVEQKFEIKFSTREILDMKNVGDMLNVIVQRIEND